MRFLKNTWNCHFLFKACLKFNKLSPDMIIHKQYYLKSGLKYNPHHDLCALAKFLICLNCSRFWWAYTATKCFKSFKLLITLFRNEVIWILKNTRNNACCKKYRKEISATLIWMLWKDQSLRKTGFMCIKAWTIFWGFNVAGWHMQTPIKKLIILARYPLYAFNALKCHPFNQSNADNKL